MPSSYADWSPASVFGATSAPPVIAMHAPSSLATAREKHGASHRTVKPEKLLISRSTSPLRFEYPVNNNNESDAIPTSAHREKQGRRDTRSRQHKQELAAQLLQRQARVWLLRRQEAHCMSEVQRLRGELQRTAKRVVSESCMRFVKRRAVRGYLASAEAFEARLSELLAHFLTRKRQREQFLQELQVIRQQRHQEEHRRQAERRRKLAAEALLVSWIRRCKLSHRCHARAVAKAEQKQRWEDQRRRSARVITSFCQAAKLQRQARQILQRRRRLRDGFTRLSHAVDQKTLRCGHTRWRECVARLKRDDAAASKLQQLWRAHKASTLRIKYRASARLLQRVYRGYLGRIHCATLRQRLQLEHHLRLQHHAATQLQRHVRGLVARRQFAETLRRLRERFRCSNCGVIEPGGAYCKLCGRRRKVFGPMSSLLLLQGPRNEAIDSIAATYPSPTRIVRNTEHSGVHTPILPPPRRRAIRFSQTASAQTQPTRTAFPTSSLDPLAGLPPVFSHRHEALNHATCAPRRPAMGKSSLPARRHSVVSISEQTALRAAVLTESLSQRAASAQAKALDVHLQRLRKANVAANRN